MLLKLSLHLDNLGLVNGGGYALYDQGGRLLASVAVPCWAHARTPRDAAQIIADLADERFALQGVLF